MPGACMATTTWTGGAADCLQQWAVAAGRCRGYLLDPTEGLCIATLVRVHLGNQVTECTSDLHRRRTFGKGGSLTAGRKRCKRRGSRWADPPLQAGLAPRTHLGV